MTGRENKAHTLSPDGAKRSGPNNTLAEVGTSVSLLILVAITGDEHAAELYRRGATSHQQGRKCQQLFNPVHDCPTCARHHHRSLSRKEVKHMLHRSSVAGYQAILLCTE